MLIKFSLSIFLLLLISVGAFAQEKSVSVEIAAGPTVADRFVYYNGGFRGGYFSGEGPAFSYKAALRMLYPLSEKWSAGSGLFYSRKGFKVGEVALRDGQGNTVNLESAKHFYSFLEVPVFARYYFFRNSIVEFYGTAGLSASIYLTSRVGFLNPDSKTINYKSERNNGIRPVNTGVFTGVGVLFPLNGSWKLGMEADLNSHVFRIVGGEVLFRSWLYSYGLNFVASRTF